jgi:phospholipid/cholesterol/gamma-HCH transport system substrate-binding protein
MITRKVKVQLLLIVLMAAVGMAYTGARYAGLDRLFGTAGGYRVSVALADSGGIFPNAEVTYRGVAVGQVTGLRLIPHGVTVDLHIDDSAPPIPADTAAAVADRSAIGEQTVDLRPTHDSGPFLADGSVIPRERTTLPPQPSDVLANLDQLASSVPTDALHTVVAELGTGFSGTGPALQQLIDGTGGFTATATAHLPQTVALLHNAQTVLSTQRDQATEILDYSHGLAQLAAQFKESDHDLRTVLSDTPKVADQLQWLLDHAGPALSTVVENSLSVSRVTESRIPALQQLLVAFPMVTRLDPTLSPGDRGHLSFVANLYDPPPCTKGYEGTQQRGADDFSPITHPNYDVHCAEPESSGINVRGAQNAPR